MMEVKNNRRALTMLKSLENRTAAIRKSSPSNTAPST